ncbi:MAG: aromatic ring-hydroxylating dioxygenase subunit alpha [Alphaproteobacteria bacterium]|nr:aromatic ring-hydroxylating dioxygenase subunit alpha [Alphaproteobacteria bacterium]
MTTPSSPFLRNLWYYALPSAGLKTGKMTSKLLLGEPILFARAADGKISALRDICPHRGMPLSYGKFDGCEVECCYHGWRFDMAGQCTAIPSLVGHENIEPGNIRIHSYPVQESQGGIWIFMEDPKVKIDQLPPLPVIPDIPEDQQPTVYEVMNFPCHIDHAVMGLMDPAHGPFVHQSWWWRSRRSIHEKAKPFGPSHLGFTMKRHKPSSNSKAYKLLGGTPETEISFQLPGVRIEHIRVGKHIVGNLTCVTPISETETEITNCIYTTVGWLKLLAPIAKIFARRFLGQDRNVVVLQQDGLKHEQNLMLIRDADTQARWYQQIRNEFSRAQAENRPFSNPVKETVLKWRS